MQPWSSRTGGASYAAGWLYRAASLCIMGIASRSIAAITQVQHMVTFTFNTHVVEISRSTFYAKLPGIGAWLERVPMTPGRTVRNTVWAERDDKTLRFRLGPIAGSFDLLVGRFGGGNGEPLERP